MDLYGSLTDVRQDALVARGAATIPEQVRHEMTMNTKYRKYYLVNYHLPGCIENINPNKFLRLKPKEEFPLQPLIPVEPSRLKHFQKKLDEKIR
jgi:hypothetical protein